ncbi:LacI family DNA-binding transcriptional regulator [Mangrovactinospora gilvigrisea]|nr:LacI family DNA-binding transcriptional regulator [Mangrovactinospora gilvigrisea]
MNSNERRPTIEAVAARAGVGRGTVSRVINGSPKVSARAREAVEAAIQELGYVPNRAARSLVTSRTDAIALVIPEPESRLLAEPYFADIIRGVSAELSANAGAVDLQLLLILVRTEEERKRLTNFLTARRVDGVLLAAVHDRDPLPDLMEKLDMPTVLGGRRSDRERLSHVQPDNAGGAEAATTHLLERGRRHIATITGPREMEASRSRLRGYQRALAAYGTAVDDASPLVAEADFTEEGGRAAMAELLARQPGLDAVFAASDVMAAGALAALRAAGRRVPEDVAVVGFDDSMIARHTTPPLSSVRQPIEEMGREMVRLLLDEIEERGRSHRRVVLATELVARESS